MRSLALAEPLRSLVGRAQVVVLFGCIAHPLAMTVQLNAMFREDHLDFLSELRLVVGGRLNALHILRMQAGSL